MKIKEFLESLKTLVANLAAEEEPETADLAIGDGVVRLASGVETEVEVARSGRFVDMNKNAVEITPDLMKGLASSLDLERHEPKLKLGHGSIQTDTPDFGSVVGLAYDEAKDRLMAKIRPTLALVRRIKEGSFNGRSMEFTAPSDPTKARFLHLAFLGARKPAISGLAPVALAAAEDGEPVIVLSTDEPEPEPAKKPEEKPEPEGALDTSGRNETEQEPKEKTKMSEAAKIERLQKQVLHGASARVKGFMSENVKRIPLPVVKAGFEDGMVALLAAETEAEAPLTFSMAGPDGKPKVTLASDFIFAFVAALPEQVTAAETTEIAKKGGDEEAVNLAEFEGAEQGSVEYHLAVEKERAEAKAKGETLSYLEGVQRVERKKRATK